MEKYKLTESEYHEIAGRLQDATEDKGAPAGLAMFARLYPWAAVVHYLNGLYGLGNWTNATRRSMAGALRPYLTTAIGQRLYWQKEGV